MRLSWLLPEHAYRGPRHCLQCNKKFLRRRYQRDYHREYRAVRKVKEDARSKSLTTCLG